MRDPNKLAIWRTMKKYVVHVELPYGTTKEFAILADDPLSAVANYWIRCLNVAEYATQQEMERGMSLAFSPSYVVHEGCFADGILVDTAPLMALQVFTERDKRGIHHFMKMFYSPAIYEAWVRRAQQYDPAQSEFLSDKE